MKTHGITPLEEKISRYLKDGRRLPENREAMKRFNAERQARKSPATTRFGFVWSMERLDQFFDYKKAFKEMTKEDIIRYWQAKSYLKSNSERKAMKVFFQWLDGLKKGQYPECVAWITFNTTKSKLPGEMLNEDEIGRLVSSAPSLRDRCIVSVLYESGARAGELINLKIKSVEFKTIEGVEICALRLDGKTGERQVLLRNSVPLVKQWLNEHPLKSDRESPLFISQKTRTGIANANVLNQILKRAGKYAKLQKKIHPHLIRHSRATQLAKTFTEQELKSIFGWTGGSRMPATYVHLSSADIMEKFLKMHGIKTNGNGKHENPLAPHVCQKCKLENSREAQYCECGEPLSMKAMNEWESALKLRDEIIMRKFSEYEGMRKEMEEMKQLLEAKSARLPRNKLASDG